MGKKSKSKTKPARNAAAPAPAPSHCARCGAAPAATGEAFSECARCESVRYCTRECQVAHWKEHKPRCKAISAERLRKIHRETGYKSLILASFHGDLKALKRMVAAGGDVSEYDTQGCTPMYAAAQVSPRAAPPRRCFVSCCFRAPAPR